MVAPTNVRSSRAAALLAAFQTAKGTPVSDFTAMAYQWLWTADAPIDPANRWSDLGHGMSRSLGSDGRGSWLAPDRPTGLLRVLATPSSLTTLLKSNFGPQSGSTFTLATQIDDATRRLTLAWLESTGGGTQRVVRLQDAWVHTLALIVAGRGEVMAEASYAAALELDAALSGGGVTLPASPTVPDKRVFPGALATLTRDPAGAAVSLPFDSVRLEFDQGLLFKPSMSSLQYEVHKRGRCRARLSLVGEWCDELWTLITLAQAKTKQRYRLQLVTDASPSTTLTVDLYEVAWTVSHGGHSGQRTRKFEASAEAGVDGSGNFVTVTLA